MSRLSLLVLAVALSGAQQHALSARIFRTKEVGAPAPAGASGAAAAPAAAAPAAAQAGAPGAKEEKKEEDKVPTINMKDVARLLPFRPDNQNYESFKARCVNFVNHMLERTGYDTGRLVRMMPECHWSEDECKVVEEDLVNRLEGARPAAGAEKDGKTDGKKEEKTEEKKNEKNEEKTASAPAPALMQIIPQPVDESVFGWCDVLWSKAHEKAMDNVAEKHIPAKAVHKEPLPMETGNAFEDAKNLNEWAEKNLEKKGEKKEKKKEEKKDEAGAPAAAKAPAPAPSKAPAPAAAA